MKKYQSVIKKDNERLNKAIANANTTTEKIYCILKAYKSKKMNVHDFYYFLKKKRPERTIRKSLMKLILSEKIVQADKTIGASGKHMKSYKFNY